MDGACSWLKGSCTEWGRTQGSHNGVAAEAKGRLVYCILYASWYSVSSKFSKAQEALGQAGERPTSLRSDHGIVVKALRKTWNQQERQIEKLGP